MSKTIPMIVEVEDIAVGKFLRLLEKTPGIAKYAFDMRGEGKPAKPNGARAPAKKFEQKAEEFIGELLAKGAMTSAVLKDHFRDAGRSPLSVNSQLSDMQKKGLIKKAPKGEGWMQTKKLRDRTYNRTRKG